MAAMGHSQLCFNGQSKLWFISSCDPELTCSFHLCESSLPSVWMLGGPWLRPTYKLMWTQHPGGLLSPACKIHPGWWGRGGKPLSVAALPLPQVGSNFTLFAQCLQKTKWGMFAGVLLLLQLGADTQVPSMQQSCSHSPQTYLPCKCKLSNNWVAGRVFPVIRLSLRSMTTLGQHVSQAHHSPKIPEIRVNYFSSHITTDF